MKSDSRKRLVLFLLLGALMLLLGKWKTLIPDNVALDLYRKTAVWAILISFTIWVWHLAVLLREPASRVFSWKFWKDPANLGVALVLAVLSVFLLTRESHNFKIIMDEPLLLATSRGIHFDWDPVCAGRAFHIDNNLATFEHFIDKRPIFFPFLLNLVHTVLGFSPENVFILNAILLPILVVMVWTLGWMLGGRLLGLFCAGLLGTFPMISQNACGGGFELLNFAMVLGAFLLAWHWIENPRPLSLIALCYTAQLLAQTRYESGLYIIPVGLAVLLGWRRAKAIILPWQTFLVPVFMIMVPLHQRLFRMNANLWETQSKGISIEKPPFSVDYIYENLGHAANFFFEWKGTLANSLVLSVIGFPAILLLWAHMARLKGERQPLSPFLVAAACFSVGFLVHCGLLATYFWGQLDDLIISRLSLPLHAFLLIATAFAASKVLTSPRLQRVVLGALAVIILGFNSPIMARHSYTHRYFPGEHITWVFRNVQSFTAGKTSAMIISADPFLWIGLNYPACSIIRARMLTEVMADNFNRGYYQETLVCQGFTLETEKDRMVLDVNQALGPAWELETLAERHMGHRMLRISRVKAIYPERNRNLHFANPAAVPNSGKGIIPPLGPLPHETARPKGETAPASGGTSETSAR